MKRKTLAIVIGMILPCSIAASNNICADAKGPAKKVWTITDRQVALRKRVEAGFKANELTAKEAKKMNDKLDDIVSDIDKMKTKNDGKLSYKDEGKLEKRLNDVSLCVDKYKLQKRVIVH